jgi:hypothetical protein
MTGANPELSGEEFDSHVQERVEKILDELDTSWVEDKDTFNDWVIDMSEATPYFDLGVPISVERYLSDKYVTDWDALQSYDETEVLLLLEAKTRQKSQRYLKERLRDHLL